MKKLVLIAMLAATTAATPAFAGNFYFDVDFTSDTDSTVANLVLKTSDTLNAVGDYDVTGIAGNVNGVAVTGLVANPDQPNYSLWGGIFSFDDRFNPAGNPFLTNPGVLFTLQDGHVDNLYSIGATGPDNYQLIPSLNNQYEPTVTGNISVRQISSPAPEPASWAMMLGGFGAIGGALRRRQVASLRFA